MGTKMACLDRGAMEGVEGGFVVIIGVGEALLLLGGVGVIGAAVWALTH